MSMLKSFGSCLKGWIIRHTPSTVLLDDFSLEVFRRHCVWWCTGVWNNDFWSCCSCKVQMYNFWRSAQQHSCRGHRFTSSRPRPKPPLITWTHAPNMLVFTWSVCAGLISGWIQYFEVFVGSARQKGQTDDILAIRSVNISQTFFCFPPILLCLTGNRPSNLDFWFVHCAWFQHTAASCDVGSRLTPPRFHPCLIFQIWKGSLFGSKSGNQTHTKSKIGFIPAYPMCRTEKG